MTSSLSITSRDEEFHLALALKVRLLSLRQIADHWFNGDQTNARRRMKQHIAADLIQRVEVQAKPLPELVKPVATWRSGDVALDYEAVAYQLQVRWKSTPVRPCSAFIATERLAQFYGGRNRGELKHPLQATHDLGVAQVWLQLHNNYPEWAQAWRGEDLLAHTRRGEKVPDAFIVNASEEVCCVIEFGGSYSAERVRDFCEDNMQREVAGQRGLPFQLW